MRKRRRVGSISTPLLLEAVFLCDRAIVLTARPARVQADFAVALPRPRTPHTLIGPGARAAALPSTGLLLAD